MKIALIKTNMHRTKSGDAMQPLFAAAIAAHTPGDTELRFYDDRIEDIPFDEPVDLAAISVETFTAVRAYEIAKEYKQRGVKTIAGGFHPTLCPDECLQHTDSVFIGDVEGTWPEVLADLKKGTLKRRYTGNNNIKGTDLKFDRTIFSGKSYGPVEMVQWSRGCPYCCDFCSIKAFYNKKHLFRPIDAVVEEIASLEKKTVFFVDDNLYFNRQHFICFLEAIAPLKIRWACQISINIASDDELLRLMVKSGCILVLIGIESFDPENLKQMNKSWNTAKLSTQEAVDKIKSYGINIYGTFIFGYDNDTTDSFKYAVDFATKNKFFLANFNPLYPMPGTPLYERLREEDRLLFGDWWLDENFYYGKSMFRPKKLSPEELEINCFEAKKEFNSWSSILSRGMDPLLNHKSVTNTLLFFYANLINRKGILYKQGKPLGK